MAQKRVSREEWVRRVRELEESGETAAAFARRRRWNAKSLTWWRWKLGQETPPEFVELAVTEPEPLADERLEVVLVNGRVIRVPPQFDRDDLATVLAVAEDA
ncbi:MAG: IS66 family insertion sequence hypothetical protein [Gemmatimonadetes bacterium]|nr:MAG: IS66 family insertion sequence hypothetical protein [Gemmatimonadota bacterium]